jgi:hypothetical protein
MAGTRPSVLKDRPELVEWLKGQSAGALFAAAIVAAPGLTPPPPFNGLQRAAVSFGAGGFGVAIEGDKASIDALETQAGAFLAMVTAEVEQNRQRAIAGDASDPGEGAAAILAAHYVRALAKKVKPARTGDRLDVKLAFDLPSIGSMVPMVGVMAAVAVPAFVKYQQRAAEVQGREAAAERAALEAAIEAAKEGAPTPPPFSAGQRPDGLYELPKPATP